MLNVSKKNAMVSIIFDSQNMTCLDEEIAGGGWISSSLRNCAELLFIQCLPPSISSHPAPLLPIIKTVSYSPYHTHSESLVHWPLLIAVEAGFKPFNPCQMCVAAPRVSFYPETDRGKCLILQPPKEGEWREEKCSQSVGGGVKLVAGR